VSFYFPKNTTVWVLYIAFYRTLLHVSAILATIRWDTGSQRQCKRGEASPYK